MADTVLRRALEQDVGAVRDLFVAAYGDDYPFRQFYDTGWLKRAVFDDDTLFLVAEEGGRIAGTASVRLAAGGLDDLIGELGRLVVHPELRGRDLGTRLVDAAAAEAAAQARFLFAEARTAHAGSQKILERCGFAPVGFEPLKYRLAGRESTVLYARLFGHEPELRRNHPRLIPEAAPLAAASLAGLGMPADHLVVDDEEGFPTPPPEEHGLEVEELSEQGWSPLLRIERGRVRGREVFGALSLAHGFFKIRSGGTLYLVARERGQVTGGVGMAHDAVDQKVRIFELIAPTDAHKGALLAAAERHARERLGAEYVEADVSAYAPGMQRTLERLGFFPSAYCPAMVFEGVERLDVVRMAKLAAAHAREDLPLTGAAAAVRDVVERSLEDRRDGAVVTAAAGAAALFAGLPGGEVHHLARAGALRRFTAGEVLLRQGEPGDRMLVVAAGRLEARVGGRAVGRIGPGETAGEMALVDEDPRSADVVALEDGLAAWFRRDELLRLMERRPRLGAAVMRNLASGLAGKLRRLDGREP